MIPIMNDKDLRPRSYDRRFLYIGTKTYELIVFDFNNGKADDQGGLYIWRYDRNPDPSRLDLADDGHLKIIGVDVV